MIVFLLCLSLFFFFTDTATTEIYTLSLHDALPISAVCKRCAVSDRGNAPVVAKRRPPEPGDLSGRSHAGDRSEEHTSELQSLRHLVCRLLLEKKKTIDYKKNRLRTINQRQSEENET